MYVFAFHGAYDEPCQPASHDPFLRVVRLDAQGGLMNRDGPRMPGVPMLHGLRARERFVRGGRG